MNRKQRRQSKPLQKQAMRWVEHTEKRTRMDAVLFYSTVMSKTLATELGLDTDQIEQFLGAFQQECIRFLEGDKTFTQYQEEVEDISGIIIVKPGKDAK